MANTTKIFDRFKGVRGLARAMGLPPSTVQRWKDSGVVPARRQAELLEVAKRLDLDITIEDVIGAPMKDAAA